MKIKLFSAILASVVAWTAFEPLQAATTTIADGTEVYIRYNAGTTENPLYYYLNGGQNYGVRAVTALHGSTFTLYDQNGTATVNGSSLEKFRLLSSFRTNGQPDHEQRWFTYDSGYKLNKKTTYYWCFEPVDASKNQYRLYHEGNSGKYIKANATFGNEVQGVAQASATVWEVVTKAQLLEEMDAATSGNFADATFYTHDPEFASNMISTEKAMWKVINPNTNDSQDLAMNTDRSVGTTKIKSNAIDDDGNGKKANVTATVTSGNPYKVQQSLTGLKNGWYRVSAYGVTNNATNACYLFANNGTTTETAVFPKGSASGYTNAYGLFTGTSKATYQKFVYIQVTDGTLIIGFKSADNPTAGTTSHVDNFELYYLGATQWTPSTYSIHFNANGATGTMTNQVFTYGLAQALTANSFTRDGGITVTYEYNGATGGNGTASKTATATFDGWATSADGDKAYNNKEIVKNLTSTDGATIDLYARWSIPSVTLPNPTKTGYTFAGWYSDAALTTLVGNGNAAYYPTADITLYAKWTPTNYTITYSLNGGTNNADNPSTYTIESATITLADPTKTGYDFEGWHTANNTTSEKVTQIAHGSTGNKTFYAQWTAHTYSVHFNGNGATSGTMSDQPFTYGIKQKLTNNAFARVHTVTYNYNGATGGNGTASATGTFAFDKWTVNADGSGTSFTNQQEVNNLTSTDGGVFNLYVKWKNGSVTLPTPTRTGYTFKGWYSDASLNNKVNDGGKSYTPSADITLYAKWETITYTITYNLNGGTNNVSNPATYNIETATISLATPTRKGYDFEGWHTANNNTSEKVTQIAQGSTGNKTLYARWTPISYSITYDLDGGALASGKTNPATYTIETNNFTLNNPSKNGYTFVGWTGTGLDDKTTSVTVAKGSWGDRSYTANWNPNTYTITYQTRIGSAAYSTYTVYNDATGQDEPQTFTRLCDEAMPALLANPTMPGHDFSGWKVRYNNEDQSWPSTMPAYNITVSGTFTPHKHNVTYKYNYEDNQAYTEWTAKNKTNQNYGTTITVETGKPAGDVTGYTFSGWTVKRAADEATIQVTGGKFTMPDDNVVIIGQYRLNTYTLTYKVDNEDFNTKEYKYKDTVDPLLGERSKTGYTWSGWKYNNAVITELPFTTMPANDVTITSTFSKNKYIVKYVYTKTNGTEGIKDATSTYEFNSVQTLKYPNPDNVTVGYTFSGWTGVTDGGVAVTVDADNKFTVPADNVTFTGAYVANVHRLRYVVDGASYHSENLAYGTTMPALLAEPTKAGYTFSGWTITNYDTKAVVSWPATMPDYNVEVIGSFKYQITYKKHDGSVQTTQMYNYGETIVPPAGENYEEGGHDYRFEGWVDLPKTMPAENITVEPSHALAYRVTYNITVKEAAATALARITADGVTSVDNSTVDKSKTHVDLYIPGEVIAPLSDTIINGYSFSGWSDNFPANYIMPSGNVSVSGTFTPNQYQLIFMVDGTQTGTTLDVNYGTKIEPANLTRSGYTFSGWKNYPPTMPAWGVIVNGSLHYNNLPPSLSNGWSVASKVDHFNTPDRNLFTIWADDTHCLALANGTDGAQGSDHKTMAIVEAGSDPAKSLENLWEMYKVDGKWLLINASDRENVLLTEPTAVGSEHPYFRYCDASTLHYDSAGVTFTMPSARQFRIETPQGFLQRWSEQVADVKVGAEATAATYKICFISRANYYLDTYGIKYNASILTPADVPLMVPNADAVGETGKAPLVWTSQAGASGNAILVDELAVGETFAALDGKKYFQYNSDVAPAGVRIYQTLRSMPAGYYMLEVHTTTEGTGGKMTISPAVGKSVSVDLANSSDDDHVVTVPCQLEADGNIAIYLDLRNYKHKESEETQGEGGNIVVKFDKFNLKYLGTSETMASALSDGEYFFRADINRGTGKSPKYLYLNQGADWGVAPVLDEHGMVFTLEERSDAVTDKTYSWYAVATETVRNPNKGNNPTFESYQTSVKNNPTNGNFGYYFNGIRLDYSYGADNTSVEKGSSFIRFESADIDNPLAYRMFGKHIKGTNVSECAAYISLSDDGVSLGQEKQAENATIWEIVTATQRIKELQDATPENPMDATFFIGDAGFSRCNYKKILWNLTTANGTNALPYWLGANDNFAQTYDKVTVNIGHKDMNSEMKGFDLNVKISASDNNQPYDLNQKVSLENLPAGRYRLSVQGYSKEAGAAELYVIDGGEESSTEIADISVSDRGTVTDKNEAATQLMAAYLFTGNDARTGKASVAASKNYRTDGYYTTLEFDLTSNDLTVGVRGTLAKSGDWVIVDNFELSYLGESHTDVSTIAAAGDEFYLYNVDAGRFFAKRDNNAYVFINNQATKFKFTPVAGEEGWYYISSGKGSNETFIGAVSTSQASTRPVGIVVHNIADLSTPGNSKYCKWHIEQLGGGIYQITDVDGRVLEWTGDAFYAVVLGLKKGEGLKADVEPRGDRWVLFSEFQYMKNNLFSILGSTSRTENWPIVRSARLNIKNRAGENAIAGLSEAYEELDKLWIGSITSSATIKAKAEALKQIMVDAMETQASVLHPVDVSFYLTNAGVGSLTEWPNTGWANVGAGMDVRQSYNFSSVNQGLALLPQFVYSNADGAIGSQTVAGLKAGRYKTSVHMKSYRYSKKVDNVTTYYTGAHYELGLTTVDGDVEKRTALRTNASALNNEGLEFFPYMVQNTPSVKLEEGESLKLWLNTVKGTVAFDDFQLLYCGDGTTGSYELSEDKSTLTLLSDWVNTPAAVEDIKNVIEANKATLVNVFILQDEVSLDSPLDLTYWQPAGTNLLFYTDFSDAMIADGTNIVRMERTRRDVDDDYYFDTVSTCTNLVITDQKPINVPQEFTAASANYKRKTSYTTDYWGSIVLPFEITKPENMTFYELQSVDLTNSVGTLNVSPIAGDVIAANEPVLFLANGALDINATDVEVHRTSELKKPQPETDPLTLYGTYKAAYYVGDVEQCLANDAAYRAGTLAEKPDISTWPNADGLCAQDCYYLKQNKFYRGYNYFTLTPFRAFVYRGCYDYLKQYYEDNPGETLDAEAATMRPSLFDIEIVEPIMDEIKSLTDETVPEIEGYYDVRGMRHSTLQKGVNIVRFEDGVTRKIFVK